MNCSGIWIFILKRVIFISFSRASKMYFCSYVHPLHYIDSEIISDTVSMTLCDNALPVKAALVLHLLCFSLYQEQLSPNFIVVASIDSCVIRLITFCRGVGTSLTYLLFAFVCGLAISLFLCLHTILNMFGWNLPVYQGVSFTCLNLFGWNLPVHQGVSSTCLFDLSRDSGIDCCSASDSSHPLHPSLPMTVVLATMKRYLMRERHGDSDRDRHTDKDRVRDNHTDGDRHRHTDRDSDRHLESDRIRGRSTDSHRNRIRDSDRVRCRVRDRDKVRVVFKRRPANRIFTFWLFLSLLTSVSGLYGKTTGRIIHSTSSVLAQC